MNDFTKTVGKRIQTIRKEQGFSQEELAHRANIHPSHLGELERGEKSPTIDSLEKIVKALNINFVELFSTIDIEKKSESSKVIDLIVHRLKDKDVKEQEVAYKLLKLFFSWKDKE